MNINIKIFNIIFILFLVTSIYSQDTIKVTIMSRGIGSVVADRIIFEINLRVEEKEYQSAFDNHKEQMKNLTEILNNLNISDSLIHFSLFSINKTRRRTEQLEVFHTNQKITVIINDFNIYDKLQLALISKGFFSFSTKFSSSNPEIGKNKAITNAIRSADQQIKQIAKELNKKEYKIINIEVKQQFKRLPGEVMEFMVDRSKESIEKIPQKINYIVELKVEYSLNN